MLSALRRNDLLPVLGNVERPVEFEMSAVVVVSESDTSLIVTTSQHARWRFLLGKLLDVLLVLGGVGSETTDHLLVLADFDALALDGLDILETREDFAVDGEDHLHLIGAAFLDGERMFAECVDRAWLGKVDGDVWSSVDFLKESMRSWIDEGTEDELPKPKT
jgi:hypothetical protein